ncbi:MAG: hypothetical protein JW726_00985 [Anaerolineales bacterium]|nr:hypothetical protein [Anaerolineales bacterium]
MTGVRKPGSYFGRDNEWNYISESLGAPQGRYLVYISGAGGVGKTAFLDALANGYAQSPEKCLVLRAIDFDDLTLRLPVNFLQRIASQLHGYEPSPAAFANFWALAQKGEGTDLASREENLRRLQASFIDGMNQISSTRRLAVMIDTLEKAPLWFPRFFAETISAIQNLVIILTGRPESLHLQQQLVHDLPPGNFEIKSFSWKGLKISLCQAYFAKADFDSAAASLIPLGININNEFKRRIWRLANGIPFQINLITSLLRYLEGSDPALNKHIYGLMQEIQDLQSEALAADIDLLRQRFQRALVTPFVINYKRSQLPGGLDESSRLTSRIILLIAHVNHYIAHAVGGFDARVLAELDGLMSEEQVNCGLQDIQEHRDTLYTFVKLYASAPGQINGIGLHDEMVRMLNNFAWMELDPPGLRNPYRKEISQHLVQYYDRTCNNLAGQNKDAPPTVETWMQAVESTNGQALLLARAFHGMYLNLRQGWNWIYELSEHVFKQSYFDTLLYDSVEAYIKATHIGEEEDTRARMGIWKAAALIARRELPSEHGKENKALEDAKRLLEESINLWTTKYKDAELNIQTLEQERNDLDKKRRSLLSEPAPRSRGIQQALDSFTQSIEEIKSTIKENEHLKDLQRAHTSLGFIYRLQSRWAEAIDNYQKALTYSHRLNDARNVAEITNNIANVHLLSAQLYQAALYCQVSTIIRNHLGAIDKLGNSYRILGTINWRIGNTYECRNYWDRARKCHQNSPIDLALLDQLEGYIYYRIGDTNLGYQERKRIPGFGERIPPVRSYDLLNSATAELKRSDRKDELSATYNILSRSYRHDRNFSKAKECVDEALEYATSPYRQAEAHLSYCYLYFLLARQALAENKKEDAEAHFEEVRRHYDIGFKLAHEHNLVDLISVYQGIIGNVEYTLGGIHPDQEKHYQAAFEHYLQECIWAARNRSLRFERALNEVVADRLARMPLDQAQRFAQTLKNKQPWQEANLEAEYEKLESEVDGTMLFLGLPQPEHIDSIRQQFNRLMRAGSYSQALDTVKPALEQFYRMNWSADTVDILLKTAQAYRKLAKYTEARRYCKHALLIIQNMSADGKAEDIDLQRLKAHADFTMGRIMWEIGNTAEAASHFTEALKIYTAYHNYSDPRIAREMREGLARAVQYEGFMRFRIREYDQALDFLDWAEAEYRRIGNQRRILKVLNIKARIYRDRSENGDAQRARSALKESLEILAKMKEKDQYAEAETYLTHMILEYQEDQDSDNSQQRLAHLEIAEQWYQKAIAIANSNHYVLLQAVCEGVLGNILFDKARLQTRKGQKPDLRPAFDQYLIECYFDTFFERRRFFRSLDFLMRRLGRLSSDEIRDYIDYIYTRWQDFAAHGVYSSGEPVSAEYLDDMNQFCKLVEGFSEYIAQA